MTSTPAGRAPRTNRRLHAISVFGFALLIATGLPATTHAQQPGSMPRVPDELRRRVERLRQLDTLEVAGVYITDHATLPALYEENGFRPLWSDTRTYDLLRAIADVDADGLRPEHYHAAAITKLADARATAADSAELDLLLSNALIGLVHDIHVGRVDPMSLDRSWNIGRDGSRITATDVLAIIDSGDLYAAINSVRSTHFVYVGLMQALAIYRGIRDSGGWPLIPSGTFLATDSVGAAVVRLRRRLAIEHDLPAGRDTVSPRFDAVLDSALRRFQHRHGLNEDGVLGTATLAQLNVPVDDRINAILVNLERARWVIPELTDDFVTVNIAGQRAYLLRDGDVVWETRTVVGRTYTRTPIFRAPMRYIVLNPTWTVPRSINAEILTGIAQDTSYLRRNRISVLDRSLRRIDADTIDFSLYNGPDFPYLFRQEPGPDNPLGRIKFMFPNPFDVYLHDTPSRDLFLRENRTFSHGCIRVENPLGLAAQLLAGSTEWNQATLLRAIESGETRTIDLETPVPVLILYWTASVDLHRETHFYRDIYGRDEAVLAALER